MVVVRDIMYCKLGQARSMVQKFLALRRLGQQMGFGAMRVHDRHQRGTLLTVVAEVEVDSLERFTEMSRKSMELKEFQDAMNGYHEKDRFSYRTARI
jgi:hypothetical protein